MHARKIHTLPPSVEDVPRERDIYYYFDGSHVNVYVYEQGRWLREITVTQDEDEGIE